MAKKKAAPKAKKAPAKKKGGFKVKKGPNKGIRQMGGG